ncbi:hypothetical protein O3P69_020184 [Scylla paramamosain]|uniref:BZIP domain-containing protein n=1 Tax=Scylla paramamosain TaxID=85552 RepID=A0AAW0TLI9_SCYPA
MAGQGRTSDHQSFLNNLLMMREQEIRLLSKKLHHQAALDSDGGSGISEGSIGSPEPHNLSMSPLRAVSPPPTTQGSYSRYSDDHHNIPSNSTLPHEPTYDQRVGEQQPSNRFHPLYDPLVEQYDQNHIYNRGADDSRDRGVYWDRRNHQDAHQESGEATRQEENRDIASRMTESFLEQQQKQQQVLATQALLGSLTTQSNHHPLLPYSTLHSDSVVGGSSLLVRALASSAPRRPRGEKKPIPETLKDEKYYERRRRNNLAAKKSRDARKQREDQIAIRASFLEKENSVLRAQVATLRDEASSLRHLLLQKKKK